MGEREGVGTLRGKSSATAIATPSCPLVVPIPSQSGCGTNSHIKLLFRELLFKNAKTNICPLNAKLVV